MGISTAVSPAAIARVVGIKADYKNMRDGNAVYLPQRIAVIGQGASNVVYPNDKIRASNANEIGDLVGYGTPLHLAAKEFFPRFGEGVGAIPVTFYPLDDAGAGQAATGEITPVGSPTETGAYRVNINNIRSEGFFVSSGDTVAAMTAAITEAINAVIDMPVIAVDDATHVTLAAKWKGESANDIHVSLIGAVTAGLTLSVTQMSGGLINAPIAGALTQMGDVWETFVLNCQNISDTTLLDEYRTFGDGRLGALTKKPLTVFTGNTEANVNTATTISNARGTDRINSQLVAPGSKNLPFVVAAAQLSQIAIRADRRPAFDYASLKTPTLIPGADGLQWDFPKRDQAVKAGSSTTEVKDNVIHLSDTVTFYHPSNDPTPAYRYVSDIVKLNNVIFNIDLLFNNDEWNGAPLLPDDDVVVISGVKRPRIAVTELSALIDSLAANGIISDPKAAKASIRAEIDSQNPKRLNVSISVKLSGTVNIVSIDLNFAFYIGAQLAA